MHTHDVWVIVTSLTFCHNTIFSEILCLQWAAGVLIPLFVGSISDAFLHTLLLWHCWANLNSSTGYYHRWIYISLCLIFLL